MDDTRFATIVLAGRPNAGKSTLLNRIVGVDLAITSPKPQSTRYPVIGIHTEGNTQLAFVDPAGLLDPGYALQEAMLDQAVTALEQADGILYLHAITDGAPPDLVSLLPTGTEISAPVLTLLTKSDVLDPLPEVAPAQIPVSAVSGLGLEALMEWCLARGRPGPFRHEPDSASAQPVRFFAGEFIRGAAFDHLEQELPYAVSVEVDEYREDEDPVYIRATIFVERESQKGMVIGRGGRTIKTIGQTAREATETLVGQRVYLDLRVKVLPKWRKSPQHLRRLGLPVPESRT